MGLYYIQNKKFKQTTKDVYYMSSQRSLKDIVEIIASETKLGKDEIHKRINDKMEELEEFVTELGAAHIVAREMSVDLSSEPPIQVQSQLTIDQLAPEITSVNVLGRVVRIYNPHTFKKKDGSDGILQSILIEDKTGGVRVVFWDQIVNELKTNNVKIGDPIRILNGYTKIGRDQSVEVHLGIRSQIQIRPSGIDESKLPEAQSTFLKISDIQGNEINLSLIAKITQIDDILEFERSDGTKGVKKGLIVGDETGEIYVNFWNDKAADIDEMSLGDIIEVIGLVAKEGLRGFTELHSSTYTVISKLDKTDDIIVKKGFIASSSISDSQLTPIDDITNVGGLISTKGIIVNVVPIYEFTRNDGSKGKVRNISISDTTGIIGVVLWDDKTHLINDKDINKILIIKNGSVQKGRNADVEIHCGTQTLIDIKSSDSDDIEPLDFDFINIKDITDDLEKVHVKGIITDLPPIQDIVTKNNETVQLRNLKIEDQTASIRITCWRNNVSKLTGFSVGDNIELFNAKIKEDTGYGLELLIERTTIIKKSLSNSSSPQGFVSSLSVSPKESNLDKLKDIEDIEEGDNVTIQATVIKLIEKQFVYPLCPECKKKTKKENSDYICSEHGEISAPLNRILFTFIANDGTGNINVLCAGKLAEIVLGMSADDAARMVDENESDKAPYNYLQAKNFVNSEFIINGKVNKNPYLKSLEIIAESIEKVKYSEATKTLINQIHTD
ncbi:DUF2240 family protein [Candidatus Heimdallarchaeota archaeon]|nr:MAG: DUF2240 family protein [Candidatus Heimdallarchaeota archaeon]